MNSNIYAFNFLDTLSDEGAIKEEDDNGAEILIPQPNRLQLSFEKISATGTVT